MSGYRLTRRAEHDLLDIFLYGLDVFGEAQAERYGTNLARCFALLAERPLLGRACLQIGDGLRRHDHASHVILYEPTPDGILILAVAHGRSLRVLNRLEPDEG